MILLLSVALVTALGFIFMTAWWFVRSGGVIDKTISRIEALEDLVQKEHQAQLKSWGETLMKLEVLEAKFKTLNGYVDGRISSFESRYGKQRKREEREQAQQTIFNAMANVPRGTVPIIDDPRINNGEQ